jgi:two-component system NtrC family sensor kinase
MASAMGRTPVGDPMALTQHYLLQFLRLLLISSVAAPVILFTFFAWLSYQTAVHTAHDRADRLAAIIREHALKVFETIGLTLENVDHQLQNLTWEEIRTSEMLWDQLRAIQERSAQIGAIFIMPANGIVALTTRVRPVAPIDFSDRDYFMAQRESGHGLYLGRAYIGKISSEPIFNFSIRKSSASGQFDGIVGVSAYVSYFQDYYRAVGIGKDNFAVKLLRDDGQVLVRYPSVANRLEIPSDSELLKGVHRSEKGNFLAHSPIDGIERIEGYAKVPGYPVYAVYGIDKNAIVQQWLYKIIPGAILAMLAAFALSSLCWIALRNARLQQHCLHALDDANHKLNSEMERRERAEASLLQTQRLEAVGQLTGGIAHDFNNLLMVISGNLELAERRPDDQNALRRKLKSIRYATDRAKALTQQLLGFARRHSSDANTVDLNHVLEKAKTLITYSVPQAIALNFELSEHTCPVRVDVSEFEAAVLNLVGNARDAMPIGGTLTISTGASAAAIKPSEGRVELRVRDTGQGMSPEILSRVFEPFYTTKEIGKGTGLGLSQVYGFVKQSGGLIDIQSEVGRGTCVTLSFPRSADDPIDVKMAKSSLALSAQALTILVAEDKPEVRQVSVAMLEDLGHQVLVARNSTEALALLNAGYPIDLLFADVTLGDGMSGLELAERAVALFPTLTVLLTTGHPGRADLLTQNDFMVLTKPYTRDGLADALKQLSRASRLQAGA